VSDDLAALATDAFVYGFPLVFDPQAVGGNMDMGLLAPAPFNSFSRSAAGCCARATQVQRARRHAELETRRDMRLVRTRGGPANAHVIESLDDKVNVALGSSE
jgi:hypothetical protein